MSFIAKFDDAIKNLGQAGMTLVGGCCEGPGLDVTGRDMMAQPTPH